MRYEFVWIILKYAYIKLSVAINKYISFNI